LLADDGRGGRSQMEVSKLKLELYDLAAIILPGFFLMAEFTVLFVGFPRTLAYAREIHGAELTLLLLCSFALGNLVPEAGDRVIKWIVGERFFKQARDRFWTSGLKKDVCDKITHLGGPANPSVDSAFDFCLTCINGSFAKRDVFLAISDLSRSLFVLSILLVLPSVRSVVFAYGTRHRCTVAVEAAALITICAYLSWSRMLRFRDLSEFPVFHSFLAQSAEAEEAKVEKGDDAE
jgi:hypothetical protein